MFGDVGWKGQLDQDTVHGGVIVDLGDLLENIGLRDGLGEIFDLAEDVCLYSRAIQLAYALSIAVEGEQCENVPLQQPSISCAHRCLGRDAKFSPLAQGQWVILELKLTRIRSTANYARL